jgi:hypothetical protein
LAAKRRGQVNDASALSYLAHKCGSQERRENTYDLSPEHVVLFPHLDHASDDLGVDKRLDRLDVLGLARDGKSLVCKSFGDGRADLIGKKRATALLGDGLVESAEGRASVWEKGKSETRGE